MRKRLIFITFLIYMIALTPCYAMDLKDKNLNAAWQAVQDEMSWFKFWYGYAYGEDCYNKFVGKKVKVTFLLATALHDNEVDSIEICGKTLNTQCDCFYVTIYKANLLFRVYGLPECFGVDNKPRAANAFPVATSCDVDLKEYPPEEWEIEKVRNIMLPSIKPYKLPPVDDNLKEKAILAAVKRSLCAHLDSDDIKKSNKIYLARFNMSDPRLLVYIEGTGDIYYLDFPAEGLLKNTDITLDASLAIPMYDKKGLPPRDGSEDVWEKLEEKIKQNSIVLYLDCDGKK